MKRNRSKWLKIIGGGSAFVALALGLGFFLGFADDKAAMLSPNGAAFWILVTVAVFIMAASIGLGALWMNSIDEAAREAHKAAWYWGGSSGMAVGGVLIILAGLPMARTVDIPAFFVGRDDPAVYAASGAMAMMLLMLLGYTIVWAWWWMARR